MTPQARPRCILCGAEGLTRSHIYGRVLRDQFPRETAAHHTLTNIDDRPEATMERWESGVGMIFSQGKWLCHECNNVWMAQIEDEALPLVAKLVRGESIDISQSSADALARWAIIASILRARLVPDGAPYNPETARRFRESGLEYADAAVWFVNAAEDPTVRANGRSASSHWRYPDLTGGVAMHWLKQLCVVVAHDEHRDVVARHIGLIRDAALPLWPQFAPGMWPTGRSAPDRMLLTVSSWDESLSIARSMFRPSERPEPGRTRTVHSL